MYNHILTKFAWFAVNFYFTNFVYNKTDNSLNYMIIFNTTFHVEESLKEDFIEYMLQKFIPASTKSGILKSPRLAQVFGSEEDEGLSFAMEFSVSDLNTLEIWNMKESNTVYEPLLHEFKEKIIGFSTIMETIDY